MSRRRLAKARSSPAWTPARTLLALAAILALAAAVRLSPLPHVFREGGVTFLADGDPWYHVLRAREIAATGRVAWHDPGLNHPHGAEVPWPPLFDLLLAGAGWLAGGGAPDAAAVEAAAAFVPVVLSLAGILVAVALARSLLGAGEALVAGLVLALLPVHVHYGVVGRADQHVLESLLLTGMLLAYVRGTREGPRRLPWPEALAIGTLLAASFWTWLGSALHVAVLGALVAVTHGAGDEELASRSRRLVGGATGLGAVLMAVAVGLLGPPGALGRVSLGGLSAFPAVLLAAACAACALLELLSRVPGGGRGRRLAELALAAAAVAGLVALAVPGFADAIGRGLAAAGRGNSWYASIREFHPLFLAPGARIADELRSALARFGLVPLLALGGLVSLGAAWRREPAARPAVLVLGTVGLAFAGLTAHMARFAYYAAVPLALLASAGVVAVARRTERFGATVRAAAAGGLLLLSLAPAAEALGPGTWPSRRFDDLARVLAPFRDGVLPEEGALLAPWDAGHHARYLSGRPVVASPFGTEGGAGAMEDMAAFFLAGTPEDAGEVLRRRRIRWVLLEEPANEVLIAAAIAGRDPAPVVLAGDRVRGFGLRTGPSYDRLVAVRLFHRAGSATPRQPEALEGFRLVHEVGVAGREPGFRLLEVVPGALVEVLGASAGTEVFAHARLATPLGEVPWVARSLAGEDGRARFRLPYATGANGAVRASPWVFTDGTASRTLAVSEEDVRRAARLALTLAPDPPGGRPGAAARP